MIKVIDRSENQIYDTNKHLIDKFAEFSSENLGFDKPVNVYLSDDHENAQDPLGKTAYYNPDKMEIHILVTGRHLKDILRSISHELVHHVQNCKGELEGVSDTADGYAQRDDHMRGMEHGAYTLGNIMNFRDFEDKFKSENPTMNENHFKKNRLEALHKLLMEQSKYGTAIRGKAKGGASSATPASDPTGATSGTKSAKSAEKDDEDGLIGGTVDTMVTLAAYDRGKSWLLKTVAKLRGPGAKKAVEEALKKGSKGATRRLLKRFILDKGGMAARRFATDFMQAALRSPITRQIAMRVATSFGLEVAAMQGGFSLTGAGTVGSASAGAVAGFALAGAAIGTGIGYAINKGLYTGYGEEIGELATKALADPDYAMKEMDVYCKGAGALCGKVVDCTGKPGGYEYETAEGLGIADEGGRSKTLLGRDWTQLAGQFHAKDGAIMAAMMSAIASDDIENERIKVSEDGKTAEVSKDANVNKYKDCFKTNMMSSIMYNKIEKAGMGAAMAELQVILGMKKALPGGEGKGAGEGPEKGQYPDKPFSKARVAAVAETFYQALEGIGTDTPKLQQALGILNKMGPKFTRAVEEYFRNTPKYQEFDPDGLRDALQDDLSGDAEKAALSAFLLADKVLGASASAGKGAGRGPKKCPAYPITPGCTGDNVGNIIAIIIRGTEFGQKTMANNKKEVEEMYNKSTYTPAVQKFFQGALQSLDTNVAKDFANKKGVIEKGDLTASLINKIAREKQIQEAKARADLKNRRLFELNEKIMKRII